MNLETVKTPSLIVDGKVMMRNAERVAARVKKLGAGFRPHVKTHRCLEIARLQGGAGIMVSTLAEARFFSANGFTDITYGVPVEKGKFSEALAIARDCERFALLTDDAATIQLLDRAARRENLKMPLFLKIDTGYHRCGVEPDSPAALELSQLIADAANLEFAGLLTHAGHSYHAQTSAELLQIARQERDLMKDLAGELRGRGLPVPIVSIGSTPTLSAVDHLEGVTEFRCGNYIFYDAFQAALGSCDFADCALTVLTAVVHRDEQRQKIVVDAGAVALSKDRGAIDLDAGCGYGRVLDPAGNDLDLRIESLSQEHGIVFVPDSRMFDRLTVGSRLRILANHSCLTALQHDHYHILEDEKIVDRWKINRGW